MAGLGGSGQRVPDAQPRWSPIIGLLIRGSPVKSAISFQTLHLTGSEPFCQETAENRLAVVKPGSRGLSSDGVGREIRSQTHEPEL